MKKAFDATRRVLAGVLARARAAGAAIVSAGGAIVAAARTKRGRRIIDRTLAVTGESLVTLGVVLGLFVAWELWWTDLGASRAQAEIVEDLDWENSTPVVPIVLPHATAPTGPVYPVIAPGVTRRTDPPPSFGEPAITTTFAKMYVPRWGYDYVKPVSQGIDKRRVLDALGIGHYPGTAMPGGWGNFAVAAHRTTYGKPFERIEEIQVGDAIVIRTEGAWFVYTVFKTDIVSPSYVGAIGPVPGQPGEIANGRYLTMTTCHPKYSARQRYVVYAELDYWAPSAAGYPPELIPPTARTTTDASAASDDATVSFERLI